MNIAFVHDRIFHIWGAEHVFFDLIEKDIKKHVPTPGKSPITNNTYRVYTLFSDKTTITIHKQKIPIITALPRWINDLFVWGSKRNNSLLDYRNLLVFSPLLCWILKRKILRNGASHIHLSSFSAVKNVVPPVWSKTGNLYGHISLYLHSPNQYIRENHQEYTKKLTWRKLSLFTFITPYLRKRDRQPRQYDSITTNSTYTAECAKKYYSESTVWTQKVKLKEVWIEREHRHCEERREDGTASSCSDAAISWWSNPLDETDLKSVSTNSNVGNAIHVQYPLIDPLYFSTPVCSRPRNYFLYLWRLTTLVRECDLIIKLCNECAVPLIVAGSGPDQDYLQSLAWPTVTFIWRVTDTEEKIELIRHARGLINLAKESCGIATMEALALWVPVFGYSVWWTAELVWTWMWILTDSKELPDVKEKFSEFMEMKFERREIREKFLRR